MYCNRKYSDIEQWIINKHKNHTRTTLRVLQFNIRGINDLDKFDTFKEILQRYSSRIDVVVLGETWLKADRTGLYQLNGYKGIFSCRTHSHGGLAVFVRSDLTIEGTINTTYEGFHHISCTIKTCGKYIDVHAVYRPPLFDFNLLLARFESIISSVRSGHELILVGDINIAVNDLENSKTIEYLQLLESYQVSMTNTETTRPVSSNILDHVICSERLAEAVVNETIVCELSDHCLILSTFEISAPTLVKLLHKDIVDHRRLEELFVNSMAGLSSTLTANDRLCYVIDSYNTALEQCTRRVTVQAKLKGHCPWMTLDTWKLLHIKENLLEKSRKNPTDERLKVLLRHASNKLNAAKAKAKRNYYTGRLDNSNQRNTWNVVNEVLGRERSKSAIQALNYNGRTISEGTEICECLNEYFCNVGKHLADSIVSDRDIFKFGTLKRLDNSIFLSPSTIAEVSSLIQGLNPKKSAGPDNIPISFVKNHHSFFAALLVGVFNEIILTGQFPQCLKIAKVVPILKSGDAKESNNYRPISTLSVLDKIIEKLIASRLVDYLNRFELLFSHQYGFRQGSSTLTAAVDLVDAIYSAMDSQKFVGALFIDLRKAFDTIDHTLLIKKLNYAFGIRGVAESLIRSYLDDRSQFVVVGDSRSSLSPISIGVPQGSNLGPLLFLMFINDIAELQIKGQLRLFADDTSVFYENTRLETLQNFTRQDIVLLNGYFKANLLSLNLSKTKFMIIHSSRRPVPPHDEIEFEGHRIEEVPAFCFLGLTLDETMTWGPHIEGLRKKLSSLCGVLRKVSAFLPRACLESIYFSLVNSRLQYLVAIWGQATKQQLRGLQVIQNRCLKAILHKPFLYSTVQLYSDPSKPFLPIQALSQYQILLQMHKIATVPTLHHNSAVKRRVHIRSSRQAGSFVLEKPKTEMGKKRLAFLGSKLYNDLPPSCKAITRLHAFKYELRRILKQKIDCYLP